MALVGFGVQRVRVIPIELLRRGGMAIAPGTVEALGADAYVHDPPQDEQMVEESWLVDTMALGDGAPTAPAGCTT